MKNRFKAVTKFLTAAALCITFIFTGPTPAYAGDTFDYRTNPETGALTGVARWPETFVFTETAGITVASYTDNTDGLSVAAYYPVTESGSVNQTIREFITEEIGGFLGRFPNGSLDIRFSCLRHSEYIVCFVFEIRRMNENISEQDIKTFAFDLMGGCGIELRTLFDWEYDYIAALSALFPPQEDFSRFAFDDASLYLYLDVDEATVEVSLPLWEFGDNLVIDRIFTDYFTDYSADSGLAYPQTPMDSAADGAWFNAGCEDAYYPMDASAPPDELDYDAALGVVSEVSTMTDGKKYVALTFDDGPHREYTPRLLDALAEYNAKATFFVLGHRLTPMLDIITRMYLEGHSIGNHTYGHKQLTTLSRSQMEYQIKETNDILESVTGSPITLLRPPYGSTNSTLVSLVSELNMSIINWDIDPKDWKYFSAKGIADHVIERVQDGSIILLHDMYETSVEAAEIILKTLTEMEYIFVTVDELINMDVGLVPGGVYRNGKTKSN